MNYWLMKSEPEVFSIDDLKNRPDATEPWDGVRNYQARNWLRDSMKKGDLAFFYHSNCATPAIVGLMEIVENGAPDTTAFNPHDPHFDPLSDPQKPRWYHVKVRYLRHFKHPVTLAKLKQDKRFIDFSLVRRGNRLSVMPVEKKLWELILSME